VLSGEVKDLLLLDVTPLSLGVETLGGVMTKLIERNTTIPARRSEVFSTASDSQTAVEVHVLQGERDMAGDNRSLGRFHLQGIPPAPRGVPQVEVTFDIDANGILNVTAKDKATNKEQKITISHSSGLQKDEVEKMVAEARSHESEDKERRSLVEERNKAEQLAYQAERMVKDSGDKISAGLKASLEASTNKVNEVRGKEDRAAIQEAVRELEATLHKAAEELYKSAGPGSQAEPAPGGSAPAPEEPRKPDDVVDAEFHQSQ